MYIIENGVERKMFSMFDIINFFDEEKVLYGKFKSMDAYLYIDKVSKDDGGAVLEYSIYQPDTGKFISGYISDFKKFAEINSENTFHVVDEDMKAKAILLKGDDGWWM